MAVLTAIPVALILIRHFSRATLFPCGVALFAAATLVAAAFAYDRWVYEHDPNFSGFRDFNQVRRVFNDLRWTSYTPATAPIFSQVGWTENDHAMISCWYYDDPQIYSEAKLNTIAHVHSWKASRLTSDLGWQALRSIGRHRAVLSVLLVLPFVIAIFRYQHAQLP